MPFANTAPKPGARDEGDVHLLSIVLNGRRERSELRIYDGAALERGDICRIELPWVVPMGFHGSWVPAVA